MRTQHEPSPASLGLGLLACRRIRVALLTLLALLLPGTAWAAPEAHILRVDPRTAQEQGSPVLTTLVEVIQSKRISEATAHCAALGWESQLNCVGAAMDKPYALYTPFPFPEANAVFTVRVDGADMPAKFVSKAKWGDSLQQPGVGTAWLILIDADSRMGNAFDEARTLAQRFVSSMGPNDIVNLMFFNDRQIIKDSRWLTAAQRGEAEAFAMSVPSTFASKGRNRTLLTIIKNAVTDSFKALGNVGQGNVTIPLHQAMVLLSSGFGGADPSSTGPGALELQRYMTQGRIPEDNTALPKAPVPVISVLFPHSTWEEFRQNSLEFMQNLPNPEIGGFFSVMRDGQGGRADAIVNAVRTRFAGMYIAKWRVSCISPTVNQSFQLVFNNVQPPIAGDSTFKDVPMGIDPTKWPLDINMQLTQESARKQGGVYPGGTVKVYGDFCWGGDTKRAEVYFLPSGTQTPEALTGQDIEKAKQTQQQLIEMGMRGKAIEATDTSVEFEAPDNEKILQGSGERAVTRLVVYDNTARRASGVTADSIIELKGTTAPFPILFVLGGAFALIVVILLLVVILRSGGKKKHAAAPPPAPVVASGPGFGAPPYGAPPQPGYGAVPMPPQQPSQNPEFMYGSPGAVVGMAPPQGGGLPPPDPYGSGGAARQATLQGAAGVFTIVPGVEMRAGRDGAQCAILLGEPRVSALHATLKLENGQLWCRDEGSNNGSQINGNRLAAGAWAPVPNGSLLRFGPVEFTVRLE